MAVPDLTFPGRSLDGPAFGERGAAVCLPGSPGLWLLSVPLMSVCLSQLYAWATNTPIISSKATGLVTADHEPSLCPRALPATVTKHRPAGSPLSPLGYQLLQVSGQLPQVISHFRASHSGGPFTGPTAGSPVLLAR